MDTFVQLCRTHRVPLEPREKRFFCPAGRHLVDKWLVVNRRTGRLEYEASAEKGATRMGEGTERVEARPHEPKSKTLERAKFEDGTRAVLFIRITKEPKRWGGDPFRLRWQQGPFGKLGKKGTQAGVAKTFADEAAARAALKAAVKSAIADGWKQVPILTGGPRILELKPIPSPKKRADA